MIWIFIIIILIAIVKSYFDVVFDFQKELGVIWYSYKGKRGGIILWGSKY